MSENKKPENNEEIDLTSFMDSIKKVSQKVFSFLQTITIGFVSVIMGFAKTLLANWLIITAVIIVGFIGGKILEKNTPTIYISKMLVRPHFDSKYQLVNNIDYFNALLESKDFDRLSNIFKVQEDTVKELLEFGINPGPESENDRIRQYDIFLKSIDSVRAQSITYEDFINNRGTHNSDIFEISIESKKKDIYKSLQEGLNNSIVNDYSNNIRDKRDSVVAIERRDLIKSLAEVKKMQEFYIKMLEREQEKKQTAINIGPGLTFTTDDNKTREYDLFNKEIEIRNEIRELDKVVVEDNEFFDVISDFQEIGRPFRSWKQMYSLIVPVLGLFILFFVFVFWNIIRFIKNYEH